MSLSCSHFPHFDRKDLRENLKTWTGSSWSSLRCSFENDSHFSFQIQAGTEFASQTGRLAVTTEQDCFKSTLCYSSEQRNPCNLEYSLHWSFGLENCCPACTGQDFQIQRFTVPSIPQCYEPLSEPQFNPDDHLPFGLALSFEGFPTIPRVF